MVFLLYQVHSIYSSQRLEISKEVFLHKSVICAKKVSNGLEFYLNFTHKPHSPPAVGPSFDLDRKQHIYGIYKGLEGDFSRMSF